MCHRQHVVGECNVSYTRGQNPWWENAMCPIQGGRIRGGRMQCVLYKGAESVVGECNVSYTRGQNPWWVNAMCPIQGGRIRGGYMIMLHNSKEFTEVHNKHPLAHTSTLTHIHAQTIYQYRKEMLPSSPSIKTTKNTPVVLTDKISALYLVLTNQNIAQLR